MNEKFAQDIIRAIAQSHGEGLEHLAAELRGFVIAADALLGTKEQFSAIRVSEGAAGAPPRIAVCKILHDFKSRSGADALRGAAAPCLRFKHLTMRWTGPLLLPPNA